MPDPIPPSGPKVRVYDHLNDADDLVARAAPEQRPFEE